MRAFVFVPLLLSIGFAQRPPLEPAANLPLPKVLHFCSAHCLTFTLEGDVLTNYTNLAGQHDVKREFIFESFTRDSVIIHRIDTGSNPGDTTYRGKMSADGNSVTGDGWRIAWGSALDTLPANDPPAQASGQLPNQAAALNVMRGIFNPQLKTAQEISYRLQTLQSRINEADGGCNSHRSTHERDPGGYCDKRDELKSERDELIAQVVQEMSDLEDLEPKVTAECKAGNKQSCQTLEKVKSGLARDRAVRY